MKNKYKLYRIAAVICALITLLVLFWSWKTGNHTNRLFVWLPLLPASIFQNMSSKEKEKLKRPNSYERQKMKGLIYRDITLLKLYLKWPVLIFSMIAFVAMFIKRFESLSMVAMLPAIFVYATSLIFDDDDKFNWEKYLRTLPVSPVKVVWSRTVVFSGFVALGTAISFAISMISFVFFREQPFAEYLKMGC